MQMIESSALFQKKSEFRISKIAGATSSGTIRLTSLMAVS